jgi:hypothetical protein
MSTAAYEAHFAWRSAPLKDLGEGYQRLVADTVAEHSQCRLCKLVARMRAERAPVKRAREEREAAERAGGQQQATPLAIGAGGGANQPARTPA